MIFGATAVKLLSSVLTQEEVLLLERLLESSPEVYDYCSVMTDEQLNHLIEFLSRQKENIFLELKHVKSERDACVAERDAYRAERDESVAERDEYKQKLIDNEKELARKDRIIKSKNKQLEKKDKKISDLQERLDDANENRYGDKQQRSKSKKSDDNKDNESSKDDKGQNNTQSSNNPDSGDVDRTRQEEECDEGSRGRKVLTDFLGDAELEAIMTDGYNAYNFLDGQLSIDHLHCMAHFRAKFIKAHKLGRDLNYFDHFKEGLFLYRTNGNYPIDNNIAERQVLPFAAMRKVIEHFGDFFEDMITGGKKHLALLNLSLG